MYDEYPTHLPATPLLSLCRPPLCRVHHIAIQMPPISMEDPMEDLVCIDLEAGDLEPFCEMAAVFDDRVIFSFVPTGTGASNYLVTYEVQADGVIRVKVEQQRFEGISASHPIEITEPRGEGECVGISITIATPEGEDVLVSSSLVGG